MNVILVRDTRRTPIRLTVGRGQLIAALAATLSVILVIGGIVGYGLGDRYGHEERAMQELLASLQSELSAQEATIARLGERNDRHLDALTLRLGELKARAIRLEALGQRLTQLGQLADGEFDFQATPALGGPQFEGRVELPGRIDVDSELDQLSLTLERQGEQLSVLEELIANRELERELEPSGHPIQKGWVSSYYGKRADPFNGQADVHPGIDFTGPADSEILAVAGGVVVWSGRKSDYGLTVDIDHGNGYVTRYAHNQKNLVELGDRVTAGQVIAVMGSTGRSTAPHVHFEVWLDGRRINPYNIVTAAR